MRTINKIIIHCSATPGNEHHSVAEIDRWHRARGFNGIGYHFVIYRDGVIKKGRPIEEVGAHCLGHNSDSIGICYIGGLDSKTKMPKDTRSGQQKIALSELLYALKQKFPNATIHGHNEFSNKACPCYDVRTAYGVGGEKLTYYKTQKLHYVSKNLL